MGNIHIFYTFFTFCFSTSATRTKGFRGGGDGSSQIDGALGVGVVVSCAKLDAMAGHQGKGTKVGRVRIGRGLESANRTPTGETGRAPEMLKGSLVPSRLEIVQMPSDSLTLYIILDPLERQAGLLGDGSLLRAKRNVERIMFCLAVLVFERRRRSGWNYVQL